MWSTGGDCVRSKRCDDRVRHLRYLLAEAEISGFRAATRALDVQVSAVSRRIRDLEDEKGAALFVRSHQGVKLTYAETRFVCHAQAAIGKIRRAAKDGGAIGRAEDGVVRIGIFSSMASDERIGLAFRIWRRFEP